MMHLPRIAPKRRYSFSVDSFMGGIDQRFDEQISSPATGAEAYNVSTDDGALKLCGGYSGASKYNVYARGTMALPKVPEGVKRIHVSKVDGCDMLVLEGDNQWYEEDMGQGETVFKSVGNYGSDIRVWLDYSIGQKSMKIISGPSSGCSFIKEDGAQIYNFPGFSHAVIYAERLFGVGDTYYPNRIYFSAQYDPSELNEGAELGGYIDVNSSYGKAVGMVIMGSCIYIFWQHGITELRGYGYQSEFVLRDCYQCSQLIFDNVQLCGERIIFAAEDGIYSFDGERIKSIGNRVRILYQEAGKQNAVSVFWSNSYYLALHSDRFEGSGNNVLLKYNCALDKWDIFAGIYIKYMVKIVDRGKNKMLFLCDDGFIYEFDGSAKFGGRNINAKWSSPMSSLGKPDMLKQVRCVYISAQGDGSVDIGIESERGRISKSLLLSKERQVYCLPLRIKGHMVKLTVGNRNGSKFTVAEPVVVFTAG